MQTLAGVNLGRYIGQCGLPVGHINYELMMVGVSARINSLSFILQAVENHWRFLMGL